ncbi:FANCD2 opposite strand protein [Eleutherodactylus coqui]|uniref:Uncharacterized protein n=1 Tax=Eleutherodactylus coqui TaxID=57060 RepID=A0A8J6BCV0_ELECQ|nr:hypothetical protein GDO78_017616 [Eleutherodactylus coqui]
MGSYQLWFPWMELDEDLQWLRGTTARPRGRHPLPAQGACVYIHKFRPSWRCAADSKNEYKGIIAPQPVRLLGLDQVFGRFITVQPPMGSSSLHISDHSAFSRVISQVQPPSGSKGTDVMRAAHM